MWRATLRAGWFGQHVSFSLQAEQSAFRAKYRKRDADVLLPLLI
jgi:hypothetical protein